ncbi:MAG TPA: hypothetical protein VIG39_02875 [Rhizomicrobium sp.]
MLSTAGRCNAIADYRVWLDCYYGAAQSMRALLGLAPAPAAQVGLVPPAGAGQPPAPVASAARPAPALPPEAYEDYRPRQKMASYSFDADHLFTVILEDGSVWQQSKEDFVKARWNAPAGSYYASVTRGSFGSHLLKVSDKHSYRVKRVR